MPQLFPVFEAPQIVEQQQTQTGPKYGRSWVWDFATGDFVLDGRGRPVEADGHTAWVQWCVKAVLTQRFAHVIYSSDYGAEIEDALKQPTRSAIESEIKRTITEALLVDPRTETVRDFAFSWSGDELTVAFTVVPTIGSPERLEVSYRG